MKKTIKSENGRSMVEMLGVLAVIGVLSVGGIAAYRMAMEQIVLNKVSEITKMFLMSLVPDHTIYENIRLSDGTFDETTADASSPTSAVIDATLLFADTYGLKCPEDKMWIDHKVLFGCQVANDLYVRIQPLNNFQNLGETISIAFVLRRASQTEADDKQLYVRVMERVRDTLLANPEMAETWYGVFGYGVCNVNDGTIKACFEYMSDDSKWGWWPAVGAVYNTIGFLY